MEKTMKTKTYLSALALAGLAALATPSAAADLENLYKDKKVTILFGYGVGGTYGKTSLVLSRHLGNFIPGNPTVITQSMPGAGGLKSANYAYNVMPKNGMNLLMPPDMSMVSQLLRPTKVKYNARNFTWLGRVFGSNNLIAVRRDAGVTSIDQVKNKQILMASTGKGSPTFIVTALVNGLVSTKFKIVEGYKGSHNAKLSMEQGETQGISLAWASWKSDRAAWFTGGDKSYALPLVQSGFERDPDLANVPIVQELVSDPDAKSAADLIATSSLFGRGLVLPPGAPKELIEPLREAFWKTVQSPEFLAEVKRTKLDYSPMKGADIQKTVDKVLNMSPKAVAMARTAIFGK
jgi:tripartite-type tricarboxylate transporter receptor subunit TctC